MHKKYIIETTPNIMGLIQDSFTDLAPIKELPEISEKALTIWEEKKTLLEEMNNQQKKGLENQILAGLIDSSEYAQLQTPNLEQMLFVYRTDPEEPLEAFPLMPLSIKSTSFTTELVCVNTKLAARDILKSSELYAKCIKDAYLTVELFLTYKNPSNNEHSKFTIELSSSDLTTAIDKAEFSFTVASTPIITLKLTNSIICS